MTTTLSKFGIVPREGGGIQQRFPCPRCDRGPQDDAFCVNIETGEFYCHRCLWKGRADDPQFGAVMPRVARIDDPAVVERKRERLRKTLRESVSLLDSRARAVRTYLDSRALGDVLSRPPTVLRAHPGLPYWDRRNYLGSYPAMIALFHGATGQPVTVHVTYLRADGCAKATVRNPKKLLPVVGSTKGGSIRLYSPREGVLGIAEGIETALSLHVLQHVPVWAAFCADNLSRIQLPPGLRRLYIGVDIDANGKGEQVAETLAARVSNWQGGPKVLMVMPQGPAPRDLNDDLRQRRAV